MFLSNLNITYELLISIGNSYLFNPIINGKEDKSISIFSLE